MGIKPNPNRARLTQLNCETKPQGNVMRINILFKLLLLLDAVSLCITALMQGTLELSHTQHSEFWPRARRSCVLCRSCAGCRRAERTDVLSVPAAAGWAPSSWLWVHPNQVWYAWDKMIRMLGVAAFILCSCLIGCCIWLKFKNFLNYPLWLT